MQDYPIRQYRAANPGSEGEQNCVAASPRSTPQHFAHECRSRIIVGVNRYIGGDNLVEQFPLQELQISRNSIDAG
jgi:hypothetical protein